MGSGARPPLARASANRPARAAPACSRPGRGPGLRGRGEWLAGDRPCPAPVLQQGGPGLRPETARPQGAAPRAGVSPVAPARSSVNSAPRTPPGTFSTGSGRIRASAAAAWLGRGRQVPRGSGERPSRRDHVGGGSPALAFRPRPRRPLHRRRVVPHADGGRLSPGILVHGEDGGEGCVMLVSRGRGRETEARED